MCQQCKLSRFCQKARSWHAFLFCSFLLLLSLMLIFKVSFPSESGRLHWAINRKFQPWSVGVGDGWERSEEDQEFVWQYLRAPKGLWLIWSAWELPLDSWMTKKKQCLQYYFCITSLLNIIFHAVFFFFNYFNLSSLLNFGLCVLFAIITPPTYLICLPSFSTQHVCVLVHGCVVWAQIICSASSLLLRWLSCFSHHCSS